jgi:DNA polymerase V
MREFVVVSVLHQPVWLPFIESLVPAGFPSPALDHESAALDLNALLLPHPDATYLIRCFGDSMMGGEDGIRSGSLLAVDCTLKPQSNDVVIASLDGMDYTLKRLIQRPDQSWWLVPDNPTYAPVPIESPDVFTVWGVVTHIVNETRPGKLGQHVRAR